MTTTPQRHLILEQICDSEAATATLAAALGTHLQVGDLVALRGDLGAGKTTLARALIRARLGHPDEAVPSPTFTLLQTYDDAAAPIAHFDLYRVEDPSELVEMGWDDALADAIALVEWPEHAGALLPARRIDVTLSFGDSEGTRRVTIERMGNWDGRLHEL